MRIELARRYMDIAQNTLTLFDKNKDGIATWGNEIRPQSNWISADSPLSFVAFKAIDRNNNQSLDVDEIAAMSLLADTNRDGQLNQTEQNEFTDFSAANPEIVAARMDEAIAQFQGISQQEGSSSNIFATLLSLILLKK